VSTGGAILLCAAAVLIAGGRLYGSRTGASEVHRRGAQVLSLRKPVGRSRDARRARHTLTLAGVPIPTGDEAKHFKIIGTTGTGKSTAICELLGAALARGDRAIVADPGGSYHQRFYERYRGDVLLNPFESDSRRWDLFAEIRQSFDAEELASGLIATSEDASSREWRQYARTFLSAVTRRCHESGRRDVAELWRLVAVAPGDELRSLVSGTPAQPFLDADNSRMFASIRSVTVSAVAALEYIQAQRGAAFSIRDWLATGRGVLFLPYRPRQLAALRSLIAAWNRLAIFEVMSQAEEDQRLWFVIDELDALGAIDGLRDALPRLRKFGGRCVLGFQSIAQVSSTYGSDSQTIVENCGTTLILRCSGSEGGGTAQFASRLIGEREVVRRQITRGRDHGGWLSRPGARRSTQVHDQRITETAVLPSELEQLPDLVGYLKTASARAWTQVSVAR
jgi:type IV secretory pathway TraG/TraD family ATPase VirD4